MIHQYSKIKTDRNYNEDFKTFMTVGMLRFLPANLFWNLIRESVISGNQLPTTAGEILQMDFWTKWYERENTNNELFVEPDVFVRFENFDCIIELKKTDTTEQSTTQWNDQITAYRNRYGDDKRLIYIALGGVNNSHFDYTDTDIHRASWHRLLHAVNKAWEERKSLQYTTASTHQQIRILQSVIEAFGKYNEYDVEFLDEISCIEEIVYELQTINEIWKNL